MHKSIMRMAVAVAAAAALGAFGMTGAGASATPRSAWASSVGASKASAAGGTQVWVKRYNGPGNGADEATSVAASPSGGTVFVTGHSQGTGTVDYATVAYNATTGAQLWVKRYNGPGNGTDDAAAVRVSPDGATVFVTGTSVGLGTEEDYTTVAYRASDGRQLWAQRYNGPGDRQDFGRALSVARDGTKVFVTGESWDGTATGYDYATIAYNAATGAQLWVNCYIGLGSLSQEDSTTVISPGGNRVFVTGSSRESMGADYATIALNATTGATLWSQRYQGPAGGWNWAYALAASPDLRRVFVTGESLGTTSADYATVAYNATTGSQLWAKRYNGPGNRGDWANAVSVAPDGSKVFVTGESMGTTSADYATLAYNATTGSQLWAKRYNGPGNGEDGACSVVSPGNGRVYVTGESLGTTSADYATLAYNSTGALLWAKRYNGPSNGGDLAFSLAMSPDLTKLFVTGYSLGLTVDYATIAYSG